MQNGKLINARVTGLSFSPSKIVNSHTARLMHFLRMLLTSGSFFPCRRLDLHVPRFSISGKYVLKGLMKRLGVIDVFTNNADLSGITGAHNLMVSKV